MSDPITRHWATEAYPRYAHDITHPDVLAATARWFGLDPAPVEGARVLEIACASGDNLLPMAARLPGGRFVGIDVNPEAIAIGQRMIDEFGLTNAELHCMDLREADVEDGTFDYVIAHGLYTWVPEDVRVALLALIRRALAPNGVGYVSFNALPGWYLWGGFRQILLERFGHLEDPRDKAQRAREYFKWLSEGQSRGDAWWSVAVRQENYRLHLGSLESVALDQLAPLNTPLWIRQFADDLAPHGLSWLGETWIPDNYLAGRSASVRDLVDGVVDPIERATLIDHVVGRTFRRTLICHGEREIGRPATHAVVVGQWFTTDLKRPEGEIDLSSHDPVVFQHPWADDLEVHSPLFKAALLELIGKGPVRVEDWLAATAERCGADLSAVDAVLLQRALFDWAQAGVVDPWTRPLPWLHEVSDRPVADPWVRYAAANGHPIVNVLHGMVVGEAVDRHLLPLCDGSRDLYELARALDHRLAEGPLGGVKEDVPVPAAGPDRLGVCAAMIRARLKHWREHHLLVA